jgi:hypothetical protein
MAMAEHSFGTDKGGGFNEFSKAYKRDPSIEHYVRLRREHPDAEIEVSVIGGIDQLFYMESELRRFGIDPELVSAALDADAEAISELSLQLMEKMIEGRRLTNEGKTHLVRRGLAIPDKLIDWIVTCSIDAMSWTDQLYIPRDLIVLIRERLGGSNTEYEQGSRVRQKKSQAAAIGGQLRARGIIPTYKVIGEILDVAPSTVMRWFKKGEFDEEVARWSAMFDREGNVLPLAWSGISALHPKGRAQR